MPRCGMVFAQRRAAIMMGSAIGTRPFSDTQPCSTFRTAAGTVVPNPSMWSRHLGVVNCAVGHQGREGNSTRPGASCRNAKKDVVRSKMTAALYPQTRLPTVQFSSVQFSSVQFCTIRAGNTFEVPLELIPNGVQNIVGWHFLQRIRLVYLGGMLHTQAFSNGDARRGPNGRRGRGRGRGVGFFCAQGLC